MKGFSIAKFFLISVTLMLALGVVGTVWAAIQWGPHEEVNVSQNGEASQVALSIGAGQKAIAWYVNVESGDRQGDLILAQNAGSGWSTQTITTTLQSRGPSLAYSGTALFMVWFQGQQYEEPASAFGGHFWERYNTGQVRRVTETMFYGSEEWFRPKLKVAQDGLHLVFAAAVTSTGESPRHLYYAYRPFSSNSWSVAVVVTSSQVGAGKVFFPDAALGQGQIHIVWEQRALTPTIYYISGTIGDAGPTWAAPVALSAPDQNGQQPAIAVDGSGRIHVAWTRYVDHAEQYVLYRRLEGGNGTEVQYLSGEEGDQYLKVNQIRPTVVWPAIATGGNQVCVAWHGFYPDSPYEKEEIFLRCSKDGGTTWGPILNASRSPDSLSLFPVVAMDAGGVVHLAWEEFQGGTDYFTNYDAIYAYGLPNIRVFLPLVLRNYR